MYTILCQCPSTGYLHFYGITGSRLLLLQCVSMPFNGLPSFLRSRDFAEMHECMLQCQCPSTGYLHFYLEYASEELKDDAEIVCQCPSTGYLHFYPGDDVSCSYRHFVCVNALQRATFISTHTSPFFSNKMFRRVNALQRATFISTMRDYNQSHWNEMCQCPSTGYLHFYKGYG